MTKKDESPEEAANPYWSDELLAVLAEALGDEDRARQTLEGIIQQAQEGKAMQTLSTERLASHLTELYGRIAEGVQNSGVKKRRSLDTKSGVVAQAATAAIDKAHSELLEELLEERVAMAEELAERKRELTKAKDKSDATVRVASALERAKEAAEAESRKASAALEKLKGERAATLLRSQKAEIKANDANAKREALRTATEEMLSLLSQMNPDMVKPVRDALRAAKTPSEPPPQEELQADYTTPEERDGSGSEHNGNESDARSDDPVRGGGGTRRSRRPGGGERSQHGVSSAACRAGTAGGSQSPRQL